MRADEGALASCWLSSADGHFQRRVLLPKQLLQRWSAFSAASAASQQSDKAGWLASWLAGPGNAHGQGKATLGRHNQDDEQQVGQDDLSPLAQFACPAASWPAQPQPLRAALTPCGRAPAPEMQLADGHEICPSRSAPARRREEKGEKFQEWQPSWAL